MYKLKLSWSWSKCDKYCIWQPWFSFAFVVFVLSCPCLFLPAFFLLFGLKMTKTIFVLVPGFLPAYILVDDDTQTIVSLQPEIRRQMGLRPTEFVQLGYHRRVSGSAEIETVWVPNSMTVRDAYDFNFCVKIFLRARLPSLPEKPLQSRCLRLWGPTVFIICGVVSSMSKKSLQYHLF